LGLLLLVLNPFMTKPAGLDPKFFAGRPQIDCGTKIAKRKF
jgi:hypothetical protein